MGTEMLVARPDYGWDLNNYNYVNEGPNAIITEDTIYVTFSGAGVDENYCIGLLTADKNADLLDTKSWTKSNQPLLDSRDNPGECGIGHNSYVVDEKGDIYNVYHARPEKEDGKGGDRLTGIRKVIMGADGEPILYLTPETELAEKFKSVKTTVVIKNGQETSTPEVTLPITDVNKDKESEIDWYYEAVANVFEKGLMTGMNDTYFGAYEEISRAQFAVILYRMEGEPEAIYNNEFPDVKETEGTKWYTSAVAWANKNGLITGYTHNGHFGAADPITREQLATILYRYAQWKGYDLGEGVDFNTFNDVAKVSGFAKDALSWAVGNKIITGKDNETRLDPQGTAKRAECVVMVDRFLKFIHS